MLLSRFLLVVGLVASALGSSQVAAQADQQGKSGKKYEIRYKLKAGELLVSKVVHFAETRTRMANLDEDSRSRTTSEKVWEVKSVAPNGDMTFEYRINSVNLAQSVGDAEELKYNSKTDAKVPPIFKQVAETVSKPLALVTINARGQVIDRDEESKLPQLGVGELTIPLPKDAIAIGSEWSVPRELRVKLDTGSYKKIAIRELYTLEKVSAGLATISIETQPLTPIVSPSVESKLMQQLSNGKIKFDIDSGRLVSKQLDWSHEVVGFRGADTLLRYDAKFTEELISDKQTAAKSGAVTR